jgi:hypothetical protein
MTPPMPIETSCVTEETSSSSVATASVWAARREVLQVASLLAFEHERGNRLPDPAEATP